MLSAWPQAQAQTQGLAVHSFRYQTTPNLMPQAPGAGEGGSCPNGWRMQIPVPTSAHQDCITAESSRGPHGSCSHQNTSSGTSMSSPGWQTRLHSLPIAVGTGALSPHVTLAAVPHPVPRLTPEAECVTTAVLLFLQGVCQGWPLSWCR